MSEFLFPHEEVRPVQDKLISVIDKAMKYEKDVIAHAPTGLGKTAASLAATLSNHLRSDKTILFLTSMHTQHQIAIDTVREIKKKHGVKIVSFDLVGKKHLCLQPGVQNLSTKDFADYCRTLREDGKCQYYKNLRHKDQYSVKTKTALSELKVRSPITVEEARATGEKYEVCPYEVNLFLGKESKVIVTDYYYAFHPGVRDTFLQKIDKHLDDLVLIVDEAHNLPGRLKNLATESLTSNTLMRAGAEAADNGYTDLETIFKQLHDILKKYQGNGEEHYVKKDDFYNRVNKIWSYDALIETLEDVADEIREEEKQSYIGSVAEFLEAWKGSSPGFSRIFEERKGYKKKNLVLHYKCLDAGVISRPVIKEAHSTVMMSGTLTPTNMYREILGFEKDNTMEVTLQSPFPDKNKLNLIIPKTSTKYKKRSPAMFKEMGKILSEITNTIPGNVAVFAPSYALVEKIGKNMTKSKKTTFTEQRGMTTEDKFEMLEAFKSYKKTGAVLLGVTSGNFSEGIDLPGDELRGVVIVGLPLARPDLATKATIDYYDMKFGKGWDYGYIYPAFNKTLQSAGRCIRSNTDKGAIIFLDERYVWNNYRKCFPETWDMRVSQLYKEEINRFFGNSEQATLL